MLKHPALVGGLLLGLFGVLGSALVALTWMNTAARIAQNEHDALLRQLTTLIPANEIDNHMLADSHLVHAPTHLGAAETTVYTGRRDGKIIAVVLSPVVAPNGYNGAIRLIVGIRVDGSLAGVRVLSHKETPGLGDKIEPERNDWITRFAGQSLRAPAPAQWKVKRDGGNFDQFTGATITPRAVVLAVKRALEWTQAHHAELFDTGDTAGQQEQQP